MTGPLGPEAITYERAKELARSGDASVRRALAEREDLSPELLYYLAEDASADVRLAVASNERAPRQTDLLLAQDTDADVRGGLAAKIATVAPGLSAAESSKIYAQTHEALATLASDQITKVRAILSDALKEVVDAPAEIIKMLASDLEIEVSGPILEFSPVLRESDLIQIIEKGPANGGVAAIARRSNVSESLADAIIGTEDVDGIADLLGNDSAQIREEALDDLINQSSNVELWHAPLVSRPELPDGAAQQMAGFLAENLLDALKQRSDLDPTALAAVSGIVRDRLGGNKVDDTNAVGAGFDFLKVEPPIAKVARLHVGDKLTDASIVKAMQAGDHVFVFAALIVRSAVDLTVARKIFVEKSPKGIVALIGKARLPSSLLVMIQQQMGRIAPSEIIELPEDDSFPMAQKEIDWQIEFFTDMSARA